MAGASLVPVHRTFARQRVVVVESNRSTANVFADGVWLGLASRSPFAVSDSTRRITVSPPGLDTWSIEPFRFDIANSSGDTVRVQASFPWYYKFETVPVDVRVTYVGDGGKEVLGDAPLLHVSRRPLEGVFRFEKDGFMAAERPARTDLWNRYLIELERSPDGMPSENRTAFASNTVSRHRWIDVASVGTALVAGALAVHFRTKADNRFDTWKETGDPALKNEIKRLDVYSGVALGTMQVGIGVFAFRLAF
jgi:hypothetical protein